MKKLRDLTNEEELEVFNQRENGESRKKIIDSCGISERHYKDIVIKFGGSMKNMGGPKYNFNEDYFEKIDTEDKAYFLGFIVADGCISSKFNRISIIQKETDILYEFKRYIMLNRLDIDDFSIIIIFFLSQIFKTYYTHRM